MVSSHHPNRGTASRHLNKDTANSKAATASPASHLRGTGGVQGIPI